MNKQIAQTIWEQMKTMDSNLCMCMGVHKLQVIDNGLQFKVNGTSFKGLVQITLNGADLYDVHFVKLTRKQNKQALQYGVKAFDTEPEVVEKFLNIFVDELMDVLEVTVESRR